MNLDRVNDCLSRQDRNTPSTDSLLDIFEHQGLDLLLDCHDCIHQHVPCCLCPSCREMSCYLLRQGREGGHAGRADDVRGGVQLVAGGVEEADTQEQLKWKILMIFNCNYISISNLSS